MTVCDFTMFVETIEFFSINASGAGNAHSSGAHVEDSCHFLCLAEVLSFAV